MKEQRVRKGVFRTLFLIDSNKPNAQVRSVEIYFLADDEESAIENAKWLNGNFPGTHIVNVEDTGQIITIKERRP